MYSTRYDNLDRGVIKSFPLGITHINADSSLGHVTVLLSDLNTSHCFIARPCSIVADDDTIDVRLFVDLLCLAVMVGWWITFLLQ